VLWYIPLELKTVSSAGKAEVDHSAILEGRQATLKLANAKDAVYKLNAETAGVCASASVFRADMLMDPMRRPRSLFARATRQAGRGGCSRGQRLHYQRSVRAVTMATVAWHRASTQHGPYPGCARARKGWLRANERISEVRSHRSRHRLLDLFLYSLLSKLSGEEENLVWTEIDGATSELTSVWWEQPDDIRAALSAFRRDLFRPVLKKLGFDPVDGESDDAAELRRTAVAALANSDDAETIAEIKKRFKLLLDQNDDSAIPGDLRQTIFIMAVKQGGEAEYNKILEVYRKPATPQAKTAAMLALCFGSTPELRKRTEAMLLNGEVKEQDMMCVRSVNGLSTADTRPGTSSRCAHRPTADMPLPLTHARRVLRRTAPLVATSGGSSRPTLPTSRSASPAISPVRPRHVR
jgi:aminopeptidase 2